MGASAVVVLDELSQYPLQMTSAEDQQRYPGVLAPGRGFDHLAPHPGGGRMSGHVEVEQAAPAVADQKEDVEGLEGQGLNHEHISCPDGLDMVGEEGAPALAG